jgi:hypothetical protein
MFAGRLKSRDAIPQPEHSQGGVSVMSPAERFRAAVEAGPLNPQERAAHWSACARVRAQDEAARAAPSPQGELELAA